MTDRASLIHVRDVLRAVFGAANVHFTDRKAGASFPCAIYSLESETTLPMISDPNFVVSIEVTVDVEAKTAALALSKADDVKRMLEAGRFATRRTSYDMEEYETDERGQKAGEPKTLFIASAGYTVYEQ